VANSLGLGITRLPYAQGRGFSKFSLGNDRVFPTGSDRILDAVRYRTIPLTIASKPGQSHIS
jgi:hypothetical protein